MSKPAPPLCIPPHHAIHRQHSSLRRANRNCGLSHLRARQGLRRSRANCAPLHLRMKQLVLQQQAEIQSDVTSLTQQSYDGSDYIAVGQIDSSVELFRPVKGMWKAMNRIAPSCNMAVQALSMHQTVRVMGVGMGKNIEFFDLETGAIGNRLITAFSDQDLITSLTHDPLSKDIWIAATRSGALLFIDTRLAQSFYRQGHHSKTVNCAIMGEGHGAAYRARIPVAKRAKRTSLTLDDDVYHESLSPKRTSVQGLCINDRGNLVSAGSEGLVKIWDTRTDKAIRVIDVELGREATGPRRRRGIVSFCSGQRGNRLAATTKDGAVTIIDRPYDSNMQCSRIASLPSSSDFRISSSMAADGRVMVQGSTNGICHVLVPDSKARLDIEEAGSFRHCLVYTSARSERYAFAASMNDDLGLAVSRCDV